MAVFRGLDVKLAAAPASLGKDAFVSCLYGEERFSEPFCFQVQLRSLKNVRDVTALLNKPMSIQLTTDEGKYPRFFQGIIVSACIDGWSGRHTVYEFVLRPAVWLLEKTRNCRMFQQKSVTDIIKAVFKENGFSDFKLQASGSYPSIEYCVQYDESDLHFVSRLMEENGLYYYFLCNRSAHTMVITDANSTHKALADGPKLPYLFEHKDHPDQCIHYFRYEESLQTGKFTLNDFDYLKPKVSLKVTKAASGGQSVSKAEHYEYPGFYETAAIGQKRLKLRMEQAAAEQAMATGFCDVTNMLCGSTFKLTDHPVTSLNQQYLVSRLVVSLSNEEGGPLPPVDSAATESLVFKAEFDCLPDKVQYRAPMSHQRPCIVGTQTAKVTGAKGEDVWTDKYGRIKVQFHWDREGKNDENSSCWVRVAQVWAGKKIGTLYLPRVGDEVLVSFIDGDPDRPIVIGSAYNADNMPPVGLPSKATQTGVTTRSVKKGGASNSSQITIDDKKDSELVTVKSEKNFLLQVKGSEQVTVMQQSTHQVSGAAEHTYKDKVVEEYGGPLTQTFKDKLSQKANSDVTQAVKGKMAIDVTKAFQASTNDALTLKGAKEVSISAGSAKVTMKANGEVTIKASKITVQGSGDVVLKGGKVKIN
ncbi:Actin cross-linking toxin VgrG1 [BD1-7 clade bacterium]|uniref:Actin cross-linking toxin VgrG1 n=1 Tax=BD1-7 clade bacterium TaxID=2029982 RepID=A0A5S9NWR5_9GAMM|nr:Actin cross-linking toxin VgrG1 [BD1-7 clade bacterium]CAA0095760.1 Actin cross-linking toxin VgrG1 [BD1-7 clade bacterium]